MSAQKGYFLIEALIALLLLSVTLTALIGTTGQALKISDQGIRKTQAVFKTEEFLFEMETRGLRTAPEDSLPLKIFLKEPEAA